MKLINSLSDVFNSKVSLKIHNRERAGKFLTIQEDGALSSIRKLFIFDLPVDSFAVSLDVATKKMSDDDSHAFSRLNHYLEKGNGTGINKRCDLVLFTEVDGDKSVYIFDLKSSDPSPDDTCKQLINSEIYIKYIFELIKAFYNEDISAVSFFKVIGTTRVRKMVSSANLELREKIIRKKKLFDSFNIKELRVVPGGNKKGVVSFNEITDLFR